MMQTSKVIVAIWFALISGRLAIAQRPPELAAFPSEVRLAGPDAVQQLRIESSGVGLDRTAIATYESSDNTVATVDRAGLVRPSGNGSTQIIARADGNEIRIPIVVERFDNPPPIHFTNQIVPIFTKLGCNAGGCHGKSGGQNGFRLSLLGFEPMLDYETLVKEDRGRRVFPAAPRQSLLLTKAVAATPHGGGKRLEPDSHEFRLIERWIKEGMPIGAADAPTVASIQINPGDRRLSSGASQQLTVTARYTDGHTEDVTRWAQYESNETEIAQVAAGGLVQVREMAGQAAVMARYQGQVAVFLALVPHGESLTSIPEFQPANFLDERALDRWKALGIRPSQLCTDAEFIRRATLDITGTLPTKDELAAFVADANPAKRDHLIDLLLERPEYAEYFAIKWSDILRNKREGDAKKQKSTYGFYDWIRRQIAQNTSYDQFARRVIAASGSPQTAPAVVWYRSLKKPDEFVDDAAQVFLGMRLQCAKCHHHPFEKWSQDDYYGFAAFFAQVGRKPSIVGTKAGRDETVIFHQPNGGVTNPKSGKAMKPRGLGAPEPLQLAPSIDPREKLVDWMVDPTNPFFAKAVVNRYWSHFFGRGLVEPIDDLRETNPAANPILLDALAADFSANGFDLRRLVRTICTSRLYGLSSLPNESNARDKQSFARRYPQRMSAEVLLDAIASVTAVPTTFQGLPAGTRAIQLPDESVGSDFLDTFGRPKRDTACECERISDASLSQSLMLLNSNEVQSKLASGEGRASTLATDSRPDSQKIDELFWTAFGRAPSDSERATALTHLETHPNQKKEAYEDVIWALVNAKEFQFID
jgi:Protein of unknown function (DUF1549)/Protein of unknown function (DUF1553)